MNRLSLTALISVCLCLVNVGGVGAEVGKMIITLLGTGTPAPSPDRFGSAILVEAVGIRW